MTTHLEIYSPSCTTVSYVVTNKKRTRSRLLALIRYGFRVSIVLHAVLVGLVKADQNDLLPGWEQYIYWLLRLTILQSIVSYLATQWEWWLIGISNLAILYLCLLRDHTEESLLVLRGLGIQTSTTSPYFFVSSTTTFIPTTRIQDIVIHEAFKGLGVQFYLAVIVEGATEVVVVFPTLLPRRDVLEQVWRGARKCLYASGG